MALKRLFIAVNFPKNLKEKLFAEYSRILSPKLFKIVEQENLHLTLKFLGNFPEEKTPELSDSLQKISSFKKFPVFLRGFGSFGSKVLWIGIVQDSEGLEALSSEVNSLLGMLGEKFSPHLTIARSKNSSRTDFLKTLDSLKRISIMESFTVESVDLMESELLEKGAKYSLLRSFKLS